MTRLYDELLKILEKEYALCAELVELLRTERDIIVSLDPGALESLLKEKEHITYNVRLCDDRREEILTDLGLGGKTVSEIAFMADEEYRQRLTELTVRFKSIINTISELNRFNRLLIEKSLRYIKTSYSFLNSYNISGQRSISLEV